MVYQQLLEVPKIELHTHFEAAIPRAVAAKLSGHPENYFQVTNVAELQQGLTRSKAIVSSPESFERYFNALREYWNSQSIEIVEPIINPLELSRFMNIPVEEVVELLNKESEREYSPQIGWLVQLDAGNGLRGAIETQKLIDSKLLKNVAGLALVDIQPGTSRMDYLEIISAILRDHEVGISIHAGEFSGPESVWQALEIIDRSGAEFARIAHGISAVHDAELMNELHKSNITLDLAISSNLATGAVENLSEHPLKQVAQSGVNFTINTDDLTLFNSDLTAEYALALELLGEGFGFTGDELSENARRASFIVRL